MLHETVQVASYSAIAQLAVALALGWIFWSQAPNAYLIGLIGCMLILSAAIVGSTVWVRTKSRTTQSDAFVSRGILLAHIMALLVGLLWSSMPTILLQTPDSGYRLICVAATAGLISCAYVVGPFVSISTVLVVPIVLGGFLGLSSSPRPFGLYISILLTVYALFVLFSTRRMSALSSQRLLDRILVRDQSGTIGLLLNDFEEGASDWLWETDADGTLHHATYRMADALGIKADGLSGATLNDILMRFGCREKDGNGVEQIITAMANRQPFRDHVVRLRTSKGTRWWRLNGKPFLTSRGIYEGYRGVGSDITQACEAKAQISFLATHDTLTGLANRAAFQAAIEQACQADDSGRLQALLFIDIDGFKAVNDQNSHSVGDQLLKAVAARLAALCGERQSAFRLGGDEFAVLFAGATRSAAERLASTIVNDLARAYQIEGRRINSGVSIGLAYAPDDADDPAMLITRADLALYSVKASGKGRWKNFEPALEYQTLRRLHLDTQMRAALTADKLDLHYQPLVDVCANRVVGVEALLRWHDPQEGWISPAEVIPIAEATGFIAEIGRWALRKACTDILAWPGLTVAVNISSSHFAAPNFVEEVEGILDDTGLDPKRLEIEITESIFLGDEPKVFATVQRLRARGIRLALDDFGTGYSSLSYLSRLPFDKLKIDRSFVVELHRRREVLAIFEAITTMAKALNISVTVEGIETEQQVATLNRRFEGTVQGYYFSKPRPIGQLDEFMREFASRRSGAQGEISRSEDLKRHLRLIDKQAS